MFAVFASTGAGSASITRRDYWHVDHLGSIVAVSDQTGAVTQRFAYDPFGKRRFTNGAFDASKELFIDWTRFANRNSAGTLFTTLLGSERGFTGHEHLDDLGLIHMNGRIFDPLIGRFLQADPFVQFPDALAAYNRYSYVLNNPLNATDPTGYFLKRLWRNKNFRMLVSIAVAVYIGYGDFSWIGGTAKGLTSNAAANAFVSGFVSGAINSGSLEGAVMGGFTSMAFFGAGQAADSAAGVDPNLLAMAGEEVTRDAITQYALFGPTGIGRALMHAAAGCASSAIQGGDCGNGALSAGLNKAIGSHFDGEINTFGDVVAGTAQNAALGGTVSKLTGDSFANGAKTGATQYLNNAVVFAAPLVWKGIKIVGTRLATGGRLGSLKTRRELDQIAQELEKRDWTIEYGGGRGPEVYLPGPGGARKGSSYPDITATKNGRTLRINTVDTYADGLTPTKREVKNAARIRSQTGQHLLLIPKR